MTGQASFFTFGDFASKVAGDTATGETLVPVGQHGHGWEPGPKVQQTVLESALFVHGIERFQPWADDIVGTIESDDADVALVNASAGVDLREAGHAHEDEHSDESGHDHSGGMDPHFWIDPVRAKTAVDNIQEGFANVDSGDSSTYEKNASACK